jgi:hypothetical protein
MLNFIGNTFLVIFVLGMFGLYVRSFIKLITALKSQDYSLITIARGFGVFFVFLGCIMGLV